MHTIRDSIAFILSVLGSAALQVGMIALLALMFCVVYNTLHINFPPLPDIFYRQWIAVAIVYQVVALMWPNRHKYPKNEEEEKFAQIRAKQRFIDKLKWISVLTLIAYVYGLAN